MKLCLCEFNFIYRNTHLKLNFTCTNTRLSKLGHIRLLNVTGSHSDSCHVPVFAAVHIRVNGLTSLSLQTRADVSCKRWRGITIT